jgi:DNA-binding NarL/FixJ family response regulator
MEATRNEIRIDYCAKHELSQRKDIMEPKRSVNSHNARSEKLTPHQVRIIEYIAVGATDEEIAEKLRITTHAVQTEIDKVFSEFKLTNPNQAALWLALNQIASK